MRKPQKEAMRADEESSSKSVTSSSGLPRISGVSRSILARAADDPNAQYDGFAAIEHKYAGDNAFKTFIENLQKSPEDTPERRVFNLLDDDEGLVDGPFSVLHLTPEVENSDGTMLSLTAGEWVALGGDFYGIPDEPISVSVFDEQREFSYRARDVTNSDDLLEAKRLFRKAYHTLAGLPEHSGHNRVQAERKLKRIKNCIEDEAAIVSNARKEGRSIKEALEAHASKGNQGYSVAFAKSPLGQLLVEHLPLAYLNTDYVRLAQYNFDHFGQQAELAYEAGHRVAMETAVEASTKAGYERARLLVVALTQELFACHFLTDLFASGHMRTPRLELVRHVHQDSLVHRHIVDPIKQGALAGLLSMAMHDEDNACGLEVSSKKFPNAWNAKGDHCLFDSVEQIPNNLHMQETIEAALQSIVRVFNAAQVEDPRSEEPCVFNFRHYIPKPTANNFDPLFVVDREGQADGSTKEVVLRRSQINMMREDEASEAEGGRSRHIRGWYPTLFFPARSLDSRWASLKMTVVEGAGEASKFLGALVDGLKGSIQGEAPLAEEASQEEDSSSSCVIS